MQFFTEAAGKLPVLKDLKAALRNGISPVSLTGVSQIHKAEILLTLAQEQPLLAVLPDESAVRQICEDINFMAGSRLAYPYPGIRGRGIHQGKRNNRR